MEKDAAVSQEKAVTEARKEEQDAAKLKLEDLRKVLIKEKEDAIVKIKVSSTALRLAGGGLR